MSEEKPKKVKINRAISIDQLLKKKFKTIDFEGRFLESLGVTENNGVWIIWAESGNGKTSFAVQLAKELTKFGKVAYNTLEEGARMTFQLAAIEHNLKHVKSKLLILNREPIEELKVRLRRHKSPNIIFIDSFQYTGLNKKQYIALKEEFTKKLFIFISHAEGKQPMGSVARFVRYDADIKIRCEGYRAFPVSRYGGGKPFDIWAEKAAIYHNDITP